MYIRYRISLDLLRLIKLNMVIIRFKRTVLTKIKICIHNLQRKGIECGSRMFSQLQYALESLLDILRKGEEIIYNKEKNVLDEIPT